MTEDVEGLIVQVENRAEGAPPIGLRPVMAADEPVVPQMDRDLVEAFQIRPGSFFSSFFGPAHLDEYI